MKTLVLLLVLLASFNTTFAADREALKNEIANIIDNDGWSEPVNNYVRQSYYWVQGVSGMECALQLYLHDIYRKPNPENALARSATIVLDFSNLPQQTQFIKREMPNGIDKVAKSAVFFATNSPQQFDLDYYNTDYAYSQFELDDTSLWEYLGGVKAANFNVKLKTSEAADKLVNVLNGLVKACK